MDLTVCVGSSCHLQNSRGVINRFKELIDENNLQDTIELKGSFCMGECSKDGVCVKFRNEITGLHADTVDDYFAKKVLPFAKAV